MAEADKESDDEEIMYTVDRGQEIIFNWANNAITHFVPNRKKTHQSARREKGIANEITKDSRWNKLARQNAAPLRPDVALCSIWDWEIHDWMLSHTSLQSPVKSNLMKWGIMATAKWDYRHEDETFHHQQIHCHLNHRRNLEQTSHNNVATVIAHPVKQIIPTIWHVRWNRKILTFIVHSEKKFEVSNHSTWALKPKLDELPKPFDNTTSSQRPGSLIEDNNLKHICTIEVTGTGRWFLGSSLASAH